MPPGPKRTRINRGGRTPLWNYAAEGDLASVRSELAAGADPNLGDEYSLSPLHIAVQYGHIEVIRSLLEAGADPNKTDSFGNSPLWDAVLNPPKLPEQLGVEIITLLLSAGANPDHKNRVDKSPRDAATEIAGGLEVPFAGVERRVPECVEESVSIIDERTEIPLQDDSDAIAGWVWDNLVPGSGQSAWVQGELFRCIEKFR